jgi:hypothetical protein
MPFRLRQLVRVSVLAVTVFSAGTALAEDREDARNDPGQLGAQWWQHALSIPSEQNPIADQTGQFCGIGQHGDIWFLHGSLGDQERGKPIERHCTIATGKSIFLPLINFVCIPFPHDTLEVSVRECAESVDQTDATRLRIDGLPRNDLIERRRQTRYFDVTVPEDNLFGAPAGVYCHLSAFSSRSPSSTEPLGGPVATCHAGAPRSRRVRHSVRRRIRHSVRGPKTIAARATTMMISGSAKNLSTLPASCPQVNQQPGSLKLAMRVCHPAGLEAWPAAV